MGEERIRAAEAADAEPVALIYNEGIEERQATFETRPYSGRDFEPALRDAGGPPFLVAESDGEVLGWARITPFSSRECYAGVGEASIYVRRTARGRGLARWLLDELADEAERRGYWKLIALLFPENEASVALCRSAGCREVGVYERHGQLDGEWRDVLLLERSL